MMERLRNSMIKRAYALILGPLLVACIQAATSAMAQQPAGDDAAKALFEAGLQALKASHPAEAEKDFQAGLKLKPDAQAEFFLGEAARQQRQFNTAIKAYDASLALNPNSPVAEKTRAMETAVKTMQAAATTGAAPVATAPGTTHSVTVSSFPAAVGKSFHDCKDGCPEMVVIPPGEGMMGSEPAETTRDGVPDQFAKWERPRQLVHLSAPLAVGKYHVTRAQFVRFVSATGYSISAGCYVWDGSKWASDASKSWRDPGFPQTADDPVVCVSWDDATAYTKWLTATSGKPYRLLTESEWEFAARSGTSTSRYWGDSISEQCKYANGADDTAKGTFSDWTHGANCSDGYVYTSPVGRLLPNSFGLYDMLGDAFQWVQDCWHESYDGSPFDAGLAATSGDCGRRVVRGGAWSGYPRDLRAASRSGDPAGLRSGNLGFRVARTPG